MFITCDILQHSLCFNLVMFYQIEQDCNNQMQVFRDMSNVTTCATAELNIMNIPFTLGHNSTTSELLLWATVRYLRLHWWQCWESRGHILALHWPLRKAIISGELASCSGVRPENRLVVGSAPWCSSSRTTSTWFPTSASWIGLQHGNTREMVRQMVSTHVTASIIINVPDKMYRLLDYRTHWLNKTLLVLRKCYSGLINYCCKHFLTLWEMMVSLEDEKVKIFVILYVLSICLQQIVITNFCQKVLISCLYASQWALAPSQYNHDRACCCIK